MKSNKGKGLLGLIVLIIAIAVFGYMGYSHMNEIKLGLDLDGGVSITYQAVKENPTAEEMSDTIYKLQQRVEGYSNEAQVYQEGDNRINVDIPGVSDANAILEELGLSLIHIFHMNRSFLSFLQKLVKRCPRMSGGRGQHSTRDGVCGENVLKGGDSARNGWRARWFRTFFLCSGQRLLRD